MIFHNRPANRVSLHGAPAGSVLCGVGQNNQGVRISISQQQKRGNEGPLQGSFVILDVGDNPHSDSLRPLLNRTTDGAEVIRLIRERHRGRVSVANANILGIEAGVDAAVSAE